MTIPFYTDNLVEPLKTLLANADSSGEWQPVIDFCKPIIETTQDDGVLLSYTFALMEQAIAIHVDDVRATAESCLVYLKRIQHEYGGTSHWRIMLKRIIREDKRRMQKEDNLSTLDYTILSYAQKSKLAYNLQAKNTQESITKAAAIHKELIDHKDNNLNSYYHVGQYIVCLYDINQTDLANEEFGKFVKIMQEQPTHGYAFLINYCYEGKIKNCLNDKEKLQATWVEAFAHPAFTDRNGFPLMDDIQDKLLIASDKFGLLEIKLYLIKLITAERKPRMITDNIKAILNSI